MHQLMLTDFVDLVHNFVVILYVEEISRQASRIDLRYSLIFHDILYY
jgi:hypothetical protein